MVYCCARGCKKTSESLNYKAKGISFHAFPNEVKENERHKEWLLNIGREELIVNRHTKICSLHFVEEMFDRKGRNVLLKKNAVPTLFGSPEYLSQICEEQKQIRISSSPSLVTVVANKKALDVVLHDHSYFFKDNPIELKHKLECKIEMLKKKLKLCQTNHSKTKKKLLSLLSSSQLLNKNSSRYHSLRAQRAKDAVSHNVDKSPHRHGTNC